MNTSGVILPPEATPKRTLGSTLRPELGRLVLGCVCLVGTNAFSLAIPWLLKQSIDALRTLAPTVAHGIVVRDAIAIIAFAVLQALIRTGSRIFIFDAARNIEYGLRRDLLGHLTRLDPAFYRRHPTGDIMSRLTNDLTATGPRWARSAVTQSCGVSSSAEKDPLGGLSVPYDWRITIS